MENSKIEWTDHTFNPWMGCTKVSPACKNCYAERDMDHRYGKVAWGPNGMRVMTSEAYWKKPLKWNKDSATSGNRQRVFCASLADVFEDWGGHMLDAKLELLWNECAGQTLEMDDARQSLFDLIDETPNLDWLLLTKRPENIRRMWPALYSPVGKHLCSKKNVWLGCSVENQEQANKRIPELLNCRDLAPVLFLSCEPLLGPVNLSKWISSESPCECGGLCDSKEPCPMSEERRSSIDWVIAGGESGPNARPSDPEWFRSLRDQCQTAGVPFMFKQWGEWAEFTDAKANLCGKADFHAFDEQAVVYRIGKKSAGRELDGVEWNQFPEVAI